jgi:hypothetical protein
MNQSDSKRLGYTPAPRCCEDFGGEKELEKHGSLLMVESVSTVQSKRHVFPKSLLHHLITSLPPFASSTIRQHLLSTSCISTLFAALSISNCHFPLIAPNLPSPTYTNYQHGQRGKSLFSLKLLSDASPWLHHRRRVS